MPVCVAASDAPSLCNTINAQLANGLMLQNRKRANEILCYINVIDKNNCDLVSRATHKEAAE